MYTRMYSCLVQVCMRCWGADRAHVAAHRDRRDVLLQDHCGHIRCWRAPRPAHRRARARESVAGAGADTRALDGRQQALVPRRGAHPQYERVQFTILSVILPNLLLVEQIESCFRILYMYENSIHLQIFGLNIQGLYTHSIDFVGESTDRLSADERRIVLELELVPTASHRYSLTFVPKGRTVLDVRTYVTPMDVTGTRLRFTRRWPTKPGTPAAAKLHKSSYG